MQTKRFHIIYDLQNCNEKINDKEAIKNFIQNLVKLIGMHILEGPVIAEGIPQNPGLSAFVIIDYSHISIHSFTKHNEALIDIFSCKEFATEKAQKYCLDYFGADQKGSSIQKVKWG